MPINQNPDYYKRVVLKEQLGLNFDKKVKQSTVMVRRTAFYFENFSNYNRFIEETEKGLENNKKAKTICERTSSKSNIEFAIKTLGEKWYGTTDYDKITQPLTTYLFNNELDSYLQAFKNKTVNVDVTDIDQSKNIRFTEKEVGLFSFELASLGLIRVFEYYSKVLNEYVSPNNVIVEKDANGKTIKDDNGNPIFFHKYKAEIPEHSVSFNAEKGGYYSELLGRVVSIDKLQTITKDGLSFYIYPHTPEIQKHIITRTQKEDSKGRLKWSSTFKKVFIEIPKVEKTIPRIDIIVAASYSQKVNATTEMIYSSMAAIAIAEKLSRSNIPYRIIAAYGLKSEKNVETYSFVVAKKEGEAFDKNKIAILLSDARQFRQQQFKGFATAFYDAGFDTYLSESGIGFPVNDRAIIVKLMDNAYVIKEVEDGKQIGGYFTTEEDAEKFALEKNLSINRVKNAYIDYLLNSGNPTDVESAKNRDSKIVFTGALSEEAAKNQYELIINQITKV